MKVIAAFSVLAVLAAGIMAQNDFVGCPQCAAEDVACRAQCVGVPNPNSGQISSTHDCVARCDSKDPGLASSCMQACVQQNFIPHNVPNVVKPDEAEKKDNVNPNEAEKKNSVNPNEEGKARQDESSTANAATSSGTASSTSATKSSSASKSSSHKPTSSSTDDDENGNGNSAASLNSGMMASALAAAVVAKMVL
ncbi:hypothetical protein IWQ62_003620 [Dispira parvispora]|uniref:Uncharacterized protein n=1 Tax=Dispira parvispora TaxID=1520584 RepID=A0A9W8ANE3_9FUNG|nr:hypothetical protein IWQ62_003620 [Dispira parvispora]